MNDSLYPAAIDSGLETIQAPEVQPKKTNKSLHMRMAMSAAYNIQVALGVNPQGVASSVRERLDDLDATIAGLGNSFVLKAGDVMTGNLRMTSGGRIGIDNAGQPQARLHLGPLSSGTVSHNAAILGDILASGDAAAYSLVAGQNNSVAGINGAAALGSGNSASGAAAVVIGTGNVAESTNSFAGGSGSTASAAQAFAFGTSAVASATWAFAFGNAVTAGGQAAVAFGENTTASAQGAFAAGLGSTVSGVGSAAFGSGNNVSGAGSLAIGSSNVVSAAYSVVAGSGNTAGGQGHFVTGAGNTMAGDNCGAFGSGNQLPVGVNTVMVVGNGNTTASGMNQSMIIGGGNTIGGGFAILAIGSGHTVTGSPGMGFMFGSGHQMFPSGQGFMVGSSNILGGTGNSAMFGAGNVLYDGASSSFIGGNSNRGNGTRDVLFGNNSVSVMDDAVGFGTQVVAGHNYTLATGEQAEATASHSFAGGYRSRTGPAVQSFTISGNTVTVAGDITAWLANGHYIEMFDLTGGTTPAQGIHRFQVQVSSVPVFGGVNTTFDINTAPSDFTAGRFFVSFGSSFMGIYGLAYGDRCAVEGIAGVALGSQNRVVGSYGFAAGLQNLVSAVVFGGTAFGVGNVVSGATAFASGNGHTVSGQYATVFGTGNTGSGLAAFASGTTQTASGDYSGAFGFSNVASGFASFVAGQGNTASASYCIALGQNNSVTTGQGNVALGVQHTVTGSNGAFAANYDNDSLGTGTAAFGNSNVADGLWSFVIGQGNVCGSPATGYGFAGGRSSSAIGDYSFAYGRKAVDGGYSGVNILTDSQNFTTTADDADQAKRRFTGGWKLVKGGGANDVDGPEYALLQSSTDTIDATPGVLQTIAIPTDSAVLLEARVVGRRTGGIAGADGDAFTETRYVRAKNVAGVVTLHDSANPYSSADQLAWASAFAVNGTNVELQVTGAADNDIRWNTTTKVQRLF